MSSLYYQLSFLLILILSILRGWTGSLLVSFMSTILKSSCCIINQTFLLFFEGYAGGLAPCWRGSYVEFLNVQSTLSNELFC